MEKWDAYAQFLLESQKENEDTLDQGFPTWGTCTSRDTFAYPKGYI